jgi:hypothetical protein
MANKKGLVFMARPFLNGLNDENLRAHGNTTIDVTA